MPSRYKYTEYLLAKRVCSVSKPDNLAKAGRIYDMRQPLTSICRVTKEWTMTKRTREDSVVVSRVRREHDHGLRMRNRRPGLTLAIVVDDVRRVMVVEEGGYEKDDPPPVYRKPNADLST